MKRGNYLCEAGSVLDHRFMEFILELANVGLEMNELYFQDHFIQKKPGSCFVTYYDDKEKNLKSFAIYYDSDPRQIPFDLMIESVNYVNELIDNPKARNSRSMSDLIYDLPPGGYRLGDRIFGFSGFHPSINSCCSVVACLWANNISYASDEIPLILENFEFSPITVRIYKVLEEKFFQF